MPIYDFKSQMLHKTVSSQPISCPEPVDINPFADGIKQTSDVSGGRAIVSQDVSGVHPDYIEEYLMQGFSALDEALKQYFSGIRIPTKDSYRFMGVRVSGGDKSLLFWQSDLADGRIILPVCSVSRESFRFNSARFSPPYYPMALRYLSNTRDRVAEVRRPVPFLVNYTIIVWASYKKDADYAEFQIVTRFNPIAEFRMFDGHIQGNIQLHLEGQRDNSTKETAFDEKSKVRYEYNILAEAWLPLPEKIIPTIIGQTTNIIETADESTMSLLNNII